jgi:hypothetical protein
MADKHTQALWVAEKQDYYLKRIWPVVERNHVRNIVVDNYMDAIRQVIDEDISVVVTNTCEPSKNALRYTILLSAVKAIGYAKDKDIAFAVLTQNSPEIIQEVKKLNDTPYSIDIIMTRERPAERSIAMKIAEAAKDPLKYIKQNYEAKCSTAYNSEPLGRQVHPPYVIVGNKKIKR